MLEEQKREGKTSCKWPRLKFPESFSKRGTLRENLEREREREKVESESRRQVLYLWRFNGRQENEKVNLLPNAFVSLLDVREREREEREEREVYRSK